MRDGLTDLLTDVRDCTVCAPHLPLGPRPIVQAGRGAGVVIIGQAPGRRVHESGVPWDDPSGRRLREWLGIDPGDFYDPAKIALLGMGLCFPGSGPSGDAPPRPECAPLWHDRVLGLLPRLRLRIIIGRYAINRYAPDAPATVTAAVRSWLDEQVEREQHSDTVARRHSDTVARQHSDTVARQHSDTVVLPHPSPRNQGWLRANPWFEQAMLPLVRARVRAALEDR